MKNLARVQGFLDVLNTEIDDPHKQGPNTSRADWKHLSSELGSSLNQLNQMLKSKDWDSTDE